MRETSYGNKLRQELGQEPLSFIGIFDVFSASIAARHYSGAFVSGFGFAASYYGLPDIGFIAWSDMVAYVQRLRTVLPQSHLLVDIDDGYCDAEVACHVVSLLEGIGASGVVLEDQQRPRRCGHYSGKQLMEIPAYLAKLEQVLATRKDIFVVARTDAHEIDDMMMRASAYALSGADAVLVDAIPDLDTLRMLRSRVDCPIVCNQLPGGKSPAWSTSELADAGVSMVIYSTPCLFAAQDAIEQAMITLKMNGGRLMQGDGKTPALRECTALLNDNLERRKGASDEQREVAYAGASK